MINFKENRNHNFTLVILENDITAMTGHQPHPGADMERFGRDDFGRVNIEKVVRALGVKHISIIKPFKVKKSIETSKEALEFQGVSIIFQKRSVLSTSVGRITKLSR